MKPKFPMLLIQLLALVAVCGASAFLALISFGALGGLSIALAPRSAFQMVEGVVCPAGSSIDYYEQKYSYHRPGESEPHVECVAPDGSRTDVTLKAIAAVLAGSFLVCFLPVALPGALLALVFPLFLRRRSENASWG